MTIGEPEWGSDVAAAMLRRLDIPYLALNPGSSFRGLHDSVVNYLGGRSPKILLCTHEEIAVDLAHGYARVAGRAMAVALHANVGLLHAAMSLFTAHAAREPVLVIGGTGPLDATARRPWIDWLHTSNAQGAALRDVVKWETQPASVAAIPEALLRAWQVIHTPPRGPAYVCLDAGLQEQRIATPFALPDPARYAAPSPLAPDPRAIERAGALLAEADAPAILLGRASAWDDLIALSEALGAFVLTDHRAVTSFPTSHALHHGALSALDRPTLGERLASADAVLALERSDVAGSLAGADVRCVNVTLEPLSVSAWSAGHMALPAAELTILADVDLAIPSLLEAVRRIGRDRPELALRAADRLVALRARRADLEQQWRAAERAGWDARPITLARLLSELRGAIGEERARDGTLVARLPIAYAGGGWAFDRRGAFAGADGAAALGPALGMSVGAALAERDRSRRLVVAVLGDGDAAMTLAALSTAARERIPLLVVVSNNQTYGNDEAHQRTVAAHRGRPVANAHIGQRMTDPAIDFVSVARGFGAAGFGPVADPASLQRTLRDAIAAVDGGAVALVDVRTV